jgi:RNA polymerase sigma-70 factor (ECF subfamily)
MLAMRVAGATDATAGVERSEADRAMDRYADGDNEAFGLVYDTLAPCLESYVRKHQRDPQLCRDIVQQTFLNMHRGRSGFVRGALALPWAFAIARRLLCDAARSRRGLPAAGPLDEGLTVPSFARTEELVAARETAQQMARALEEMPPGQRQAFELLKEQGLSLTETAAVTGATVMAVKLRAHRAVATLRALFNGDSEGGGKSK